MGFKDLFIVSDEENTKSSNDTPRLAFPKLGDNPEPNPSKSKQTTFPDAEKGDGPESHRPAEWRPALGTIREIKKRDH